MAFPGPPPIPTSDSAYNVRLEDVIAQTGLSRKVLSTWLKSGAVPSIRKTRNGKRQIHIPDTYVEWIKNVLATHIRLSDVVTKCDIERKRLYRRIKNLSLPSVMVGGLHYIEEAALGRLVVPAGDAFLSTSETMALLGVSRAKVYSLLAAGLLVSYGPEAKRVTHRFLRSEVLALKPKLRPKSR